MVISEDKARIAITLSQKEIESLDRIVEQNSDLGPTRSAVISSLIREKSKNSRDLGSLPGKTLYAKALDRVISSLPKEHDDYDAETVYREAVCLCRGVAAVFDVPAHEVKVDLSKRMNAHGAWFTVFYDVETAELRKAAEESLASFIEGKERYCLLMGEDQYESELERKRGDYSRLEEDFGRLHNEYFGWAYPESRLKRTCKR